MDSDYPTFFRSFVSNYPTWEPPPNGQKMLGMLSTFRTRNEAASSAFPLASSAVLRNSAPYYPPRTAVSHHFSGSYRGVHSRHGGDGVQFGHRLPVPSGERAVFTVLSLILLCFIYLCRALSTFAVLSLSLSCFLLSLLPLLCFLCLYRAFSVFTMLSLSLACFLCLCCAFSVFTVLSAFFSGQSSGPSLIASSLALHPEMLLLIWSSFQPTLTGEHLRSGSRREGAVQPPFADAFG
jgi:hypothetical protein